MRRSLVLLVLAPAILMSAMTGSKTLARADGFSVLILSPNQGHSGDTIYLAGSGLDPNRHLYVLMACQNSYDKNATIYQNQLIQWNGPITDKRGEFKKFPFQVLTLHHFRSQGCTVYVPDGANLYGPRLPPTFFILAPDDPGSKCVRHICIHALASTIRTRAGLIEKVVVRSVPPWPGAAVDVTVTLPNGQLIRRHVTLDIDGSATTDVTSGDAAKRTSKALVQWHAHLGSWDGTGSGRVTLLSYRRSN